MIDIQKSIATNHAGWQVQILTMSGWIDATGELFSNRDDAVRKKIVLQHNHRNEYRVYEALNHV